MKKQASKVAHNRTRPFYFRLQPRPTAHSPELILHIMKSRNQTSVLNRSQAKNPSALLSDSALLVNVLLPSICRDCFMALFRLMTFFVKVIFFFNIMHAIS